MKRRFIALIILSAVSLTGHRAVADGLGPYTPGNPNDQKRVEDLISIAEDIESYHAKTGHYPMIEKLQDDMTVYIIKTGQDMGKGMASATGKQALPFEPLEKELRAKLGDGVRLPQDPAADDKSRAYFYGSNGQDYYVGAYLETLPFYARVVYADYGSLEITSRPEPDKKFYTRAQLLHFLQAGDDKKENQDALLKAVAAKKVKGIELALSAGANINPACTPAQRCQPLAVAVAAGNLDMVNFLIESGADINGFNDHYDVPLLIALQGKHIDVAKRLIDAGADVNIPNDAGVTPFIAAAHDGNKDLVKLMLRKDADINSHYLVTATGAKPGDRSERPLEAAIRARQPAIVDLLLKAGTDATLEGRDGSTMQDLADATGDDAIAELLHNALTKPDNGK
ncbi:MAG: ankyrin repeat domain-containing protein [Micavibrio sp.]|nr:ankyrin repeat domain-containing protein [Micavibrio sp.]